MLEVRISPLRLRGQYLDARRGSAIRLSEGAASSARSGDDISSPASLCAGFSSRSWRNRGREGHLKNREMKEGPTILLIIKDWFWEPTMFMKTNEIVRLSHDVYENKRVDVNAKAESVQLRPWTAGHSGLCRPACADANCFLIQAAVDWEFPTHIISSPTEPRNAGLHMSR